MSLNYGERDPTNEAIKLELCDMDKEKKCIQSETLKLITDEKMQIISNNDFLKTPKNERLKNITEPNISAKEITDKQEIIFNFSFTKPEPNPDLYLLTTAGQVLPDEV
jgi:hypothetical protein